MPINPYIAQGIQPIDFSNSLLQVARMKQVDRAQERQDTYQNALLQRQDRQFARQDKMDARQEHLDEAKQGLARVRWLLQPGSVKERLNTNPQNAQVMYERLGLTPDSTEEQIRASLQQLEAGLASTLGEMPAGQISSQRVGGAEVITQDGQPIGSPHWQQQFAPERPAQPQWEQVQDQSGNWYLIDVNARDPMATARPMQTGGQPGFRGRGTPPTRFQPAQKETQPRILPDPYGGPPSVVRPAQNQAGYESVPIPVAGQQAPQGQQIDRQQALAEARAAIASGRITREEVIRRLQAAGIDPSGL